jgi:ribosomal protein S12 methylthiotransferase
LKEARQLIVSGVKEINLISQDTTYFGMDKWEGERPKPRSGVDSSKGESLSTLIRELNAIPGDFWIRLLYTHPAHWSDDLIAAIAESPKVARYIDMPLQHISDNMLSLMKRETDGAYIRDLLKRIRAGIPGIAIRTTFIVGFPGETEADFNELVQFIEDEKFERAGVFNYSREEDTRAAKMDDQIHHMTRKARWNEAMRAIQRSVEHVNRQQVGKKLRVLVEEPGVARTEMDAPDIDTTIFVDKKLPVGSFADVTVKEWRGYDLVAG